MRSTVFACACLMLFGAVRPAFGNEAAISPHIGKKIENFSLRDYLGKPHELDDYADRDIVVVAFLGNDCPLAKLYAPRLEKLNKAFADRGVAFFGINSNLQDTPTRIAAYARRYGVTFPLLKDAGNAVADQFAAERTPEVFVLDQDRVVRYCGRIDDQYGVGIQRMEVEQLYLKAAIDELLAGKPVSTPSTEAVGCIIGRVRDIEPHGEITYTRHISRLLNRRCVECHREGELAPFPLATYDDVVGWGETMAEVVRDGRMPPWFADEKYGHFINDSSMTKEEKELLFAWVKNGSPEGDPADLPEPPKFAEGWRIGQPDAVFEMAADYTVPAEETTDYQYFMVDPNFEEDKWISMAEARPGNTSVVHHIVVYVVPSEAKLLVAGLLLKQQLTGGSLIPERGDRRRRGDSSDDNQARDRAAADRDDDQNKSGDDRDNNRRRRRRGGDGDFGQMVAIYAPGMPPWKYPEGTAMHVPKGAALVFQMHYTPSGTTETDRSYVGFKFAQADEVKKRIRYSLINNSRIEIPPHEPNYRETATETIREDSLLLNLFPHMHYRGKAFRFEALYPNGDTEVLLDVPRYDFNWQLRYDLAEPKLLPAGTQIRCVAHFDNSADNPLNPDPTKSVRFGLQSWQEMLVGYYTSVPVRDDVAANTGQTTADPSGSD